MSDVLLIATLIGAFSAVFIASIALNLSTQRKRAVRYLQAQVGPSTDTGDVNLRNAELSQSVLERVVLPFGDALAGMARRITPSDVRSRWERQLILAGEPRYWTPERFAVAKLAAAAGGLAGSLLLAGWRDTGGGMTFLLVIFCTVMGFYLPNALLSRAGRERQDKIRRTLPDTMDLLTISVEAGLSFDAAIAQVAQKVPGPLSEEFGRTLQEIRLGTPRSDAFRHLKGRTDVAELDSFVLSLVHAESFGVSVSKTLRAQAHELRRKRRQRAEEKAMKLSVKLVFPTVFCILPALFVVTAGPIVIEIIDTFLSP